MMRKHDRAIVAIWLFALLGAAASEGLAEPPPASVGPRTGHCWHAPAHEEILAAPGAGEADPSDWNPIAGPTAQAKGLLERCGITTDLYLMFFYQWSSDVLFGGDDFGSFAFRSLGSWQFAADTPFGDSFLEWNIRGAVGFGFDPRNESLAGGFQIGDLSIINANIYPDSTALDDLYWKQVIADGRWEVIAGRIDQSNHFDANRVASNEYRQLQGFVFVNNLSIPWALYGGIGAIVTWKATDRLTLLLGGGESGSDEPWRFWETVDDGNWYQLFEADLALDIPALGKGTYRLTPWHNHLDGADGWGVAFNFDQELGLPWLVGFFRFGVGDGDVTFVDRHVSAGIAVEGPFGRSGDQFSLAVGWSRPSDPGQRAETFIELQYRLQLAEMFELSPDLQILINPSANGNVDAIAVPGVRFTMIF
jgi:carbohydrate-selective porin OprB